MTERPINHCYGVLQQAPTSKRDTRYSIQDTIIFLYAKRCTLYAKNDIRATIYDKRKDVRTMELKEKNEVEETKKNSKEEMDEMINKSLEKFKKIKRGDIIKGQIMKVDEDGYLVDIKYKMEGHLSKNEKSLFSEKEETITHTLEIGDEVYLYVVKVDEKNGNVALSRERAKYYQIWEKLNEVYRKKEKINAEVIEKNPNGLIVNIGLKGFVPKSQIETKFIKDEDLEKGKQSYSFSPYDC